VVPGRSCVPPERQRFREIAVYLPTWDTRAESVPATSRPEICIPVFRCSGGQAHQLSDAEALPALRAGGRYTNRGGVCQRSCRAKATRTTFDATPLSAFARAGADFGPVLRGNDMLPCKLSSHG